MRVEGYGIAVDLGSGWEARIFRHADPGDGSAMPVAHIGNFSIPNDPSNFAQQIIQELDRSHALIAIIEYMKEAAGTPLFTSGRWPPRVEEVDLNPNAFAGPHPPGMAGHQNFVTVHGRAFCFYVVVPVANGGAPLLDEVNAVLESVSIGAGP